MNTSKMTRKLQKKLIGPVVQQVVEEYGKELQPKAMVANFLQWKQDQLQQAQEAITNLMINQSQTDRIQQAIAFLLQKCKESRQYKDLYHSLIKAAKILENQLFAQDYAWATSLSIQQWLEISDSEFLKMYAIASELFAEGQTSSASDILLFLSLLNPNVYQLWIALGMAEQQMQRYTEALKAYSFAMLIDFENPWSHLYSADVYVQIEDRGNAKAFLQLAHDLNEKRQDTACATFVQQLQAYLR